ncbi:hypothetical protein Tco_0903096 [Tanacetum coccineum]
MDDLTYNNQHNMVACLEKTDENAEFHEIVDFLTSSSIHYALTHIHATIDSKAVVVTEASGISSFLFNDVDGRVTPLFPSMLAQLAVAEGEGSGHPSEPQPTPSPAHPIIESQILITEHTELPQTSVPLLNVADEAVHQMLGDRMVRAVTTASLDAQQIEIESQEAGKEEKSQNSTTYEEETTSTSISLGGSTINQVSTARPEVSDASVPVNDSAATPSTPPITTVFDDEDVTMAMAQTLIKMIEEKAN